MLATRDLPRSSKRDAYYDGPNQCRRSFWFDNREYEPYSISELTITGIFLLGVLLLLVLFFFTWLRKRWTTQIAAWYTYGISLILAILMFILRAVNDSLNYCLVINDRNAAYVQVPIAVIFYGIVVLIWLGIFMIPLLSVMMRAAEMSTKNIKFVKLGQIAFFTIICIIWLSYVVVYYLYLLPYRYPDYLLPNGQEDLRKPYRRLLAAFYTLAFIAVVLTSIALAFMLAKSKRSGAVSAGMKFWLPVTMMFFFGYFLLSIIDVYDEVIGNNTWGRTAFIAASCLELIFLLFVALGLLMCASSNGLANLFPEAAAKRNKVSYYGKPPQYYVQQGWNNQQPTVTQPSYSYGQTPTPYQQQQPPQQLPVSPVQQYAKHTELNGQSYYPSPVEASGQHQFPGELAGQHHQPSEVSSQTATEARYEMGHSGTPFRGS